MSYNNIQEAEAQSYCSAAEPDLNVEKLTRKRFLLLPKDRSGLVAVLSNPFLRREVWPLDTQTEKPI